MTDQEIIKGLIACDNRVTKEFFFIRCQPLFKSIIKKLFSYEVDYDEMVNDLYIYLMEDDAIKLRNFQFRSSVYQWLKVLAIRFFLKKRDTMIDDTSHETPYDYNDVLLSDDIISAQMDMQNLLMLMSNKRYAYVIRKLILEDCSPEQLAEEMGITTANLYNIKRRAMAQLTQVAINDVKEYDKNR